MKSSVTKVFRKKLDERISLDYRVLGLLQDDHIYWFWIGAHAEYDELLQRL
ncbi:MAG: hypothetical protein V7K98_10735 [Nostoc sp.]|uniref:hypothetical protein n=1 Tax=Nostoc sp. TaxID=1180 RepID=UPI002FF9114D